MNEQEKLNDLTRWAKENGANVDNVKLKAIEIQNGKYYRGGFSASTISNSQTICSVPDKICLTETRSRDSTIGQVLQTHLLSYKTSQQDQYSNWETNHPMDPHAQGVLFMCAFMIQEQGKEKDSFWYPYLRSLPEAFETIPLCWPDEARITLLKGSNLGYLMEKRLELLLNGYQILVELVEKINVEGTESFANTFFNENCLSENGQPLGRMSHIYFDLRSFAENLSWERFLWAFCSISSRAFPKLQGNLRNAAQETTLNELCLYPFLDMLNHKRKQPIEWNTQRESGQIAFVCLNEIMENQEVFNNYGAKGNENLLGNYGFVIHPNSEDYFKLPLNISRRDPLYKLKTDKINELNLSLIHLLFKQEEGEEDILSEKLMQVLRILNAQDIASLKDKGNEFKTSINNKYEVDALVSLYQVLLPKYKLLLSSHPSDEDLHLLISLEERDKFGNLPDEYIKRIWIEDAKRYREGQQEILISVFQVVGEKIEKILRSSRLISIHPRICKSNQTIILLTELLDAYSESWSEESVVALLLLLTSFKQNLKQSEIDNIMMKVSIEEQQDFLDHFNLDVMPVLEHHDREDIYSKLKDQETGFVEAACLVSLHSCYVPNNLLNTCLELNEKQECISFEFKDDDCDMTQLVVIL